MSCRCQLPSTARNQRQLPQINANRRQPTQQQQPTPVDTIWRQLLAAASANLQEPTLANVNRQEQQAKLNLRHQITAN